MNRRRTPPNQGWVLSAFGRLLGLFLCLVCLGVAPALAQEPTVASIKAALPGLQGLERLTALEDLVSRLESSAPQEALALAEEGLALSRKEGDLEKEAAFLSRTAFCCSQTGDFAKAVQFGQESLALSIKLNNKERIARSRSTLGITYAFMGLYSKALEEHLESLRIREEMSLETASIVSLNNIGVLYHRMEQYEKAISYYQKIMQRLASKPDPQRLIQTKLNLGYSEFRLGRLEAALRQHEEALELIGQSPNKTFLAYADLNLGMTYTELKQFGKALQHLQAALVEYGKQDQKHGRAQVLNAMARLHLLSGDPGRAVLRAKEAAALAARINAQDELAVSYKLTSDAFEKEGRGAESYRYYKLYVATKEATYTSQEDPRAADMNMRIITLRKDSEIDSLKKERVISSLKLEKGRYTTLLLLISLGFMVSIVLILIAYNKKIRQNRKSLEAANSELGRLNTELQEKINEIRTLSGLLPICAQCKKIRNDEGYWEQLEGYISQHSAATFTHGICPHCLDDLYPGSAERIRAKKASGEA